MKNSYYQFIDMTGKKIGRWTVIRRAENIENKPGWLCRCDCGVERTIRGKPLRRGDSVSCGCLKSEPFLIRSLVYAIPKSFKHGLTHHPIHETWTGMMQRCYNKSDAGWHNYGGRGIKVCERWHEFTRFADDMMASWMLGLSLDRWPNNNGNYEPSNCRWATKKQQADNTRRNKTITYNGETLNYSQWDSKLGRHSNSTGDRIRRGWSAKDVIEIPIGKKRKYIMDRLEQVIK